MAVLFSRPTLRAALFDPPPPAPPTRATGVSPLAPPRRRAEPEREPEPKRKPGMKIVTWNVNGIRARAGEVAQWVSREQPDVICLQEIKASPEHIPQEIGALPEYWSFWHGHKGYSGVSMLLRRETFPGRPHFSHPEFDHETRIVIELGMRKVRPAREGRTFRIPSSITRPAS